MGFLSLGKIGATDRIIRGIIGLAILAVAFLWVGGVWQILLWVLGAVLLLEGLIGFCPLTYLRRRSVSRKVA